MASRHLCGCPAGLLRRGICPRALARSSYRLSRPSPLSELYQHNGASVNGALTSLRGGRSSSCDGKGRSAAKSTAQDLVEQSRVGLALHRLHDLADEESE